MEDNIIALARAQLAQLKAEIDPADIGGFVFEEDVTKADYSVITFSNAAKLAEHASAPTYLINKILEIDSHGILAGASQAFKSFMALEMAHCLANGVDFMGYKTFHSHKVIYVCGEGHGALGRRLRALSIAKGEPADNLLVLDQKMFIDNDADIQRISLEIQRMRPALVIFDTFSSMNSNTNENDNSEVGAVLAKIQRAIANGFTSSLIVHHFGKDAERGVRGAYAFQGNTDFVMIMEREADKGMGCRITSLKMKDGETFDEINCTARHVDLRLMNQDGTNATSLVLDLSEHSLDRFKAKPPGRPNKTDAILNDAFAICLADDPISIMGKIAIKKSYYLQVAKSMLGEGDYVRKSVNKFIKDHIDSGKMIEISGLIFWT